MSKLYKITDATQGYRMADNMTKEQARSFYEKGDWGSSSDICIWDEEGNEVTEEIIFDTPTIIETRKLLIDDVISMCIKFDLYTRGDNRAYNEMLNRVIKTKNVTAQDLYWIAKDIKEHSNTERDIESIMFSLAERCTSFFDIEA